MGQAPLSNDAATAGLKRLFARCHLAHSRSTLQCKRKNSGSRAAVPMLEIEPPKLVCAEPCGFPSMVRKFGYVVPSARVCASVRTPVGLLVLKNGRRLIPVTPSVFQNCSGLVALKNTVPTLSDSPRKSRLKMFGEPRSKRQ